MEHFEWNIHESKLLRQVCLVTRNETSWARDSPTPQAHQHQRTFFFGCRGTWRSCRREGEGKGEEVGAWHIATNRVGTQDGANAESSTLARSGPIWPEGPQANEPSSRDGWEKFRVSTGREGRSCIHPIRYANRFRPCSLTTCSPPPLGP